MVFFNGTFAKLCQHSQNNRYANHRYSEVHLPQLTTFLIVVKVAWSSIRPSPRYASGGTKSINANMLGSFVKFEGIPLICKKRTIPNGHFAIFLNRTVIQKF